LKERLLRKLTLIYPDFENPFFISTDASGYGLGAALAQQCGKRLLPVSFASKVLSKTERNYSAAKREALAVVWALKHFKYLVTGFDITILTDHQPLTSLFKDKLPDDATLARWCIQVQQFRPRI
jgi:hypothetical protein